MLRIEKEGATIRKWLGRELNVGRFIGVDERG